MPERTRVLQGLHRDLQIMVGTVKWVTDGVPRIMMTSGREDGSKGQKTKVGIFIGWVKTIWNVFSMETGYELTDEQVGSLYELITRVLQWWWWRDTGSSGNGKESSSGLQEHSHTHYIHLYRHTFIHTEKNGKKKIQSKKFFLNILGTLIVSLNVRIWHIILYYTIPPVCNFLIISSIISFMSISSCTSVFLAGLLGDLVCRRLVMLPHTPSSLAGSETSLCKTSLSSASSFPL